MIQDELGTVAGIIPAHRTHHGGVRVKDGVGTHQYITANQKADPAEADRRAAAADGDIQPHTLPARADTVHRQRGEAEGADLADGIPVGIANTDALTGGIAFAGHRIAEPALFIGDLIPCVQCRNITL